MEKNNDFILTSKVVAAVALVVSLFNSAIDGLWVWPVLFLDILLLIILFI